MVLPIFDQIQLGLELSLGSFLPIYFALGIIGLMMLSASGWTLPLGAILISGSFVMSAWAGYASYGTIGVAVVFLGYVFSVIAYALIRR